MVTIVVATIVISSIIKADKPTILQGVVACTEYRAASKIAGRIESMSAVEGAIVSAGEELYTLSTPELNNKLKQASAAKDAAQAIDNQVIEGARKQQIDAAYNLYQRAIAGYDLALKSYTRIENLLSKGVATQQQADEANAQLETMRASKDAAYAEYSLALAGATSNQKAAAAAQVAMAQAAVAEVESYIADSRVVAPISGQIQSVAYHTGELVGLGYPVVTILDMANLWIEFNIKETLLQQITIDSTFNCYIPATDSNIELKVNYIAPQANFAIWDATRDKGGFDIRTFKVKMIPTDTNHILRPGMSAIITL